MDDQLGIPNRMDQTRTGANADPGRVSAFDKWVVRQLLSALPEMPISITIWNGERIMAESADPVAGIVIQNRKALYRLIPTALTIDRYEPIFAFRLI